MKICKKCQKEFSILMKIDGKIHHLGNRSFCVDCSPFGGHNTKRDISPSISKIDAIPKLEFDALIASCRSRSEVFDKLGMRKSGRSFPILNRRIHRESTDISHFLLGGSFGNTRKWSNEQVFSCPSPIGQGSPRGRVLKDNLIPYLCIECGQEPEWNGKILILELDHVNGNRRDNRLENLRFLCPNCHSQTATFGAKKRRNVTQK